MWLIFKLFMFLIICNILKQFWMIKNCFILIFQICILMLLSFSILYETIFFLSFLSWQFQNLKLELAAAVTVKSVILIDCTIQIKLKLLASSNWNVWDSDLMLLSATVSVRSVNSFFIDWDFLVAGIKSN